MPAFSAVALAIMALVQYDADTHFGDYAHNVQRLTELADEATAHGAGMVVFPEGSTLGYEGETETWCAPSRTSCDGHRCRDVSAVAEAIPAGRTSRHWLDYAASHDTYVVYHVIEAAGGSFYNAIAVAGPHGLVASYRKRELYGPDFCYAKPGRADAVAATPYGKLGLMICADGNEDAYYRRYKQLGADAVVIPMDWDQSADGPRAASAVFQSMAADNAVDVYVADTPAWDGTGKYNAGGGERERDGLPADGVGVEGISYHSLAYPHE
jgi:predicted amidohydrolase